MPFITKDIHEKLDYTFIRPSTDLIAGDIVTEQSPNSTVTIVSTYINLAPVFDTNGKEYPAGSAIIMWLEGGVLGSVESIRLQYTTVAGRILDEEIQIVCVGDK